MTDSPYIFEATQQNFGQVVLEASRRVPVVVDFWAAWCAPCRMLMPVLAELAEAYAGKFVLAKVNTEEQQELARQYAIRSLPTVKIFRDGKVVDEFLGAQPASVIRDILERHIARASDPLRLAALQALEGGDGARAVELMRQAVETDPERAELRLDLAALQLDAGGPDAAEEVLRSLPAPMQQDAGAKRLRARIRFARALRAAPDAATLERRVSTDPDDLKARYQLAARDVMAGDYAAAMEQLFQIMQRDRSFEDDLGREGLLAVFELLGNSGELVNRYRRRMAATMY